MPIKNLSNAPVIKVLTLGCPKNVVDSERLMGQLKIAGQNVTLSNRGRADVLIINTCGFIQDAKEESVNTILEAVKAKKSGKIKKLLVMGCLSQRYMNDLEAEIPEVDKFYGVNDLQTILHDLGADERRMLHHERLLTTPSHYAFLKIAEGCDRTCSFCAIPLIRGKNISVPIESLGEEAIQLAGKGVKELILIAQDLTWYGLDIYGKRMLAPLLEKLADIRGLEWIRLHYTYPAGFPMEVLDVMATRPNICHYIDVPFQHINDELLKAMRRNITTEETWKLIENLRNKVPGIAIRTTLMTGFPGETEQHFNELKEFLVQSRFDRVGVFTYSEEEGTRAANLTDNVPMEVKEERAAELMALQQEISLELNHEKVGRTFKTLFERKEGDYYIGRTEFDSPEIDNEVLIPVDGHKLKTGSFYTVRITNADYFDLYGEVCT
ncbi:MAG: 30S ribosomal protein S12 methylthiotransferase RimO [Bacteroidales bacterium]|nr:30S ribosomal protein S12 methylthiotransferase RimO [Bacteroidales bacterium]MDZ4204959.1 30S ribosomal protein S12 methylthiotransferase RimO [Bacteroidales bacterium]